MYPAELKYTADHEWLRIEGNNGVIGITSFAQEQLGDVVFVEFPEVGEIFNKGETFGVIESVKTVSDMFMPIDGKIIAINEELNDNPDLVNENPFEAGWLIEIEILDKSQVNDLMDNTAYQKGLE